MFIEMALAAIQDPLLVAAEIRAFRSLGAERLAILAASTPELSPMEQGYLIGLTTARTLLSTMPLAVLNKVTL